ncbi:ribosomal-protein-alanine N-acetyltransferase [compost metagenome]|uniref:GNAT family N-acetyltransferase n=1 Tax=Paenibacillus sp. FSL R7-0189 TaxID=2921673 RepID=UPI000FA9175B
MNSFLIQKYSPQRDKAQIEHMLLHNKDLLKSFYQNEESNRENIVVAIMNDTSIGFLSFNGFGRKPQAILFVNKEYDTMEVGSKLIEEYENMLIHNETVEHTVFNVLSSNAQLISVLEKNNYRVYFAIYNMERTGAPFPSENILVRNYEEKDYFEWDRVCELAFYHMRQRVGMYPSFFYKPVEWEREQYAENKDNMFVMIVDETIVAVGKIAGNKISMVAISIEHQSRGYGRSFVKFLINEIISRGEDKVILEVVKGNFAKALYESLGFKETEIYHNYIKYFRPDTRLSAPPENY